MNLQPCGVQQWGRLLIECRNQLRAATARSVVWAVLKTANGASPGFQHRPSAPNPAGPVGWITEWCSAARCFLLVAGYLAERAFQRRRA
jgi:hypothetical protein